MVLYIKSPCSPPFVTLFFAEYQIWIVGLARAAAVFGMKAGGRLAGLKCAAIGPYVDDAAVGKWLKGNRAIRIACIDAGACMQRPFALPPVQTVYTTAILSGLFSLSFSCPFKK